MIVLPRFFLIFVILPVPTSQLASTKTRSSRKSKIDWEQCERGGTAQCFCIVETDVTKLVKEKNKIEPPKANELEDVEGVCNIGVQIKYFDNDAAVFQLQVIGESYEKDKNPELMLYKETEMLFGCKFNSKSGEVEVVATTKFLEFEISVFENRSYFQPENVLCAVTVLKASTLVDWIKDTNILSAKNTVMKFVTTDYTYDEDGSAFFERQVALTCNPYSFNDLDKPSKFRVMPIRDRDRQKLDCSLHGLSYTMRYNAPDEKEIQMLRLECGKTDAKPVYKIVFTDQWFTEPIMDSVDPSKIATPGVKVTADIDVTSPETYNFYCTAEIGETCVNPHKECTPSSTDKSCPKFTPGSKGNPAKLECEGNKWLIKDEYLKLTKEPACMRDKRTGQNAVAFYFTLPSGKIGAQPEARCFTDYNCEATSKLFLPDCKGADTNICGEVDNSNNVLKCKDETKKMIVYKSEDPSVTYNQSSYNCNPTTGMYFNGTVILPARSRVKCIGEAIKPKEAAAAISDGELIIYIAGAFGLFVIIIVAVIIIVFCCLKSAKKIRKKQKKTWVKMSRADRIKRCEEDFAQMIVATPDTAMYILAGIDWVELMLEAETEEGECWEHAYKFLHRLQGAFMHTDRGLYWLFARYAYLQAKKIIDKHGWLTTEPITKKNQLGLIRTVAIRLLYFAMHSPKCTETRELITTGFSILGFDAVAQYPHCGVMWSLILHDRPGWFLHNTEKEKYTGFDCSKFLKNMMLIAAGSNIKLPQDDVIPAFGTLEEQAAYAMGGSLNQDFHQRHSTNVFLKLNSSNEGAVARSYFRGICGALNRTTLQMFGMWPNPNQELLDALWELAPSAKWDEYVMSGVQTLINCERVLDARRLFDRLNKNRAKDSVSAEEGDRKKFAEAAEKVREELRDWFAARTDKEELKKKPDYILNPNLITRVTGEASAPNVEPKSNDAPAQTPKQTPTQPKDAAAPPAAPAAAVAEAPAKPAA